MVPLDDELRGRLEKVMSHFNVPCRFAFAYGSGVFPQSEAGPEHAKKPSTKDGKKMIDLVLAVMHPEHWHAINMGDHPKHYSLISRMLGGIGVGLLQKRGAGLWYNPYVKMDDEVSQTIEAFSSSSLLRLSSQLVKYGVMDVDTLCQDLLDWDTLYISGRMHKPVAMLTTDARVRLAQQVNLTSALRTSLLLLPERFSEVELYTQVASLSYTGDFRMSVPGGENSSKVRNIVLAQREMFRRLYAGLVRSLGTVHVEEMREDRFAMTVSQTTTI